MHEYCPHLQCEHSQALCSHYVPDADVWDPTACSRCPGWLWEPTPCAPDSQACVAFPLSYLCESERKGSSGHCSPGKRAGEKGPSPQRPHHGRMARLPGSWETLQPCLQLLGQPGTGTGTRKWVPSSASQWLCSTGEWPRLPVPLLIWEIRITAEPLWGLSGWGPGLGARPVPQFCESCNPASPPSWTHQERNPELPRRQASNQQTTLCF